MLPHLSWDFVPSPIAMSRDYRFQFWVKHCSTFQWGCIVFFIVENIFFSISCPLPVLQAFFPRELGRIKLESHRFSKAFTWWQIIVIFEIDVGGFVNNILHWNNRFQIDRISWDLMDRKSTLRGAVFRSWFQSKKNPNFFLWNCSWLLRRPKLLFWLGIWVALPPQKVSSYWSTISTHWIWMWYWCMNYPNSQNNLSWDIELGICPMFLPLWLNKPTREASKQKGQASRTSCQSVGSIKLEWSSVIGPLYSFAVGPWRQILYTLETNIIHSISGSCMAKKRVPLSKRPLVCKYSNWLTIFAQWLNHQDPLRKLSFLTRLMLQALIIFTDSCD